MSANDPIVDIRDHQVQRRATVRLQFFEFASEGRMGLIVTLIVSVVLAVIIVWIADWTSGARRYTALAVLNRRLASGEIDRAEYEEKRKVLGM